MNYQAIIQTQNRHDGGWLDYCREPITRTSDADAAKAQALDFARTARANAPASIPGFRVRIESWDADSLGIKGEILTL